MAGIEKCSEISGHGHGWKMYGYKRNHIQVTPQERKLFKHQKAVLFIFKPKDLRHIGKGWSTSVDKNNTDYEYHNGRWYQWRIIPSEPWNMTLYKVRVLPEYAYCLYVPSVPGTVEGCFWNWSYEMGNVKRRINRMMKYKVPVVKLDMTHSDFWRYCGSTESDTVIFNEYFAKVHGE